jgi:quinohemoprotein ethanol dehydrogenase
MSGSLRTWIALCALILGSTGCQKRTPPPAEPIQPAVTAARSPVNTKRLNEAQSDLRNWLMYGRTYGEQRFSPLTSINAESVRNLKLAWYVDLPAAERGEESTPLVIDGVMVVTTSWSQVMAVDAATGQVLWRYDPKVPGEWGINACCDVVNRGAAFWEGKVYVATLDGRLVALNASDGRRLWETLVIDRAERASLTGAPRVIKGRVFVGSAGGEFGVRGRMTAVDANTGAILWRFFTVPGDPANRPENLHLPAAQKTWTGQWWRRGGGGTVWDAMAYDPSLDLMYIGTGNGSPWPQSLRSPEGGDNLYVSSIIALRPDTGEYVWHYQTTPGDEWGFDAASQLVLAELSIDGTHRAVLIQAAANGFLYVLDRATGKLISATPFAPVSWAKGIDPATGRPQENLEARYSRTRKPFLVQPGPRGAHSWQPMAFDPLRGLLYIPAMLNSAELSVDTQPDSRYALNSGTAVRRAAGMPPDSSRLIAWDPVLEKPVWSLDRATPVASGVLATDGSLVFQGSAEGTFEALDAGTGKSLWSIKTGTAIIAAPVTYEVNGEQLVAVIAGAGGAELLEGGRQSAQHAPQHNTAQLLAFSLGGSTQWPGDEPPHASPAPPQHVGSTAQISQGATLYARYCARCHGEGALNAGPLKDLKHSEHLADASRWRNVVYAGLLTQTGMPGFMAELKPEDVEAVRAYVVGQAGAATAH